MKMLNKSMNSTGIEFLMRGYHSPTVIARFISNEGRRVFEVVNLVIICGILGLFGIAANVVNIIIFYKHGLANTVNIALLGLSVSDLGCLVTLEWTSAFMNPLLATSGVPWLFPEIITLLSGAWPHVCFCRITSYITVYITAERYISIALPLKVKEIVTPRRTGTIICLIYLVNTVTLIPEYATSYLGWRFVPARNLTLLTLLFTSSRQNVEGLCFAIHSLLSATSFFGVIVFTIVLVAKLRQSSKWRKVAASGNRESGSNNSRDQKTVKMVIVIACILICCYTPGAIISMAMFSVGTDFSLKGRYVNICVSAWSIAYSFQTLNSSVNIFLYYRMSSKYRQTFNTMFVQSSKLCGKTRNKKCKVW